MSLGFKRLSNQQSHILVMRRYFGAALFTSCTIYTYRRNSKMEK